MTKHKPSTTATTQKTTTTIARLNWRGLADSGFALLAGAADNKNLGTQTLAASCLALLAERPVSFTVGEAAGHGDMELLADWWQFSARGAVNDEKTMRAFKQAVFAELLPPKPEADSKNGVTIKTADYAERLKVWNAQRAALALPFSLAAALASRQYDAGDFLVGHGFNVARHHIVPEGFNLDTGNPHRPQNADDVICLDYSSPLAKSKPRNDQTTHIRDAKSAGIAVVTHTVESYIRAQRPAVDNNIVKGQTLASAVEYIAKQAKNKETPPAWSGEALNMLNQAHAYLARIIEVSNKPAAKLVDVNETTGRNEKVA